ncbi:hypothetical protein ABIQ69_16970 [Agromyces sp. G08B096]|uniref:Uncharacterized protein n=1 Tax=Agromyces sp. G08B096 TaxID=3156399 RepID=A0AAU7W7H1_9MICO
MTARGTGRSTTEVIHDHLARRLAGDIDGDIEANYSADVVLLSRSGEFRGPDGVRDSAAELAGCSGRPSSPTGTP